MSRALLIIAIVALLLALRSEHAPLIAPEPSLLVQADYPVCVTIRNGPIAKTRTPQPNLSQRGTA